MMNRLLFILLFTLLFNGLCGQILKPDFSKAEYVDMLRISAQFGSNDYAQRFAVNDRYRMVYESSAMGFDNKWMLWMRDDGVAIISIRGTTKAAASWTANFYAAMVPAKGSIKINKDWTYDYHLADVPEAMVHVGWLIASAHLMQEIKPVVDSLCNNHTRNIMVTGHSQGGAISFLVSAQLHHARKLGLLPNDLSIKTYCSAAPKPGNLFFAYDFGATTQSMGAFNVVNAADWVPQTPASIQTLNDMNTTNPFKNIAPMLQQQSFFKRLAIKHVYNKLTKPALKAQRQYNKYLGNKASAMASRQLPGFESSKHNLSFDYTPAGTTIALLPDENYYHLYPKASEQVFTHHLQAPYLYLIDLLGRK